jgi:predicted O-methyltransferase YrrM
MIREQLARVVRASPLHEPISAIRARRTRRVQLASLAATLESNGIADRLAEDIDQWAPFVRFAPPGHFYSPIPRLDALAADSSRVWTFPDAIPGIDHRPEGQRATIEQIADVLAGDDLPDHETPDRRYYAINPAYGIGDGTMLHGMLRLHRPRRIVEIGSGYSSALILDTIERHLPDTTVTFVEPYSELLRSLMRPGDEARSEILETRAQDLDPELVRNLAAGDILFIDSTHVVRTGSDVCRIVLELLPEVAPGVVVHIHDMFWPFELPRHWVEEGRQWAECYLVRAFLTGNSDWEILLMNDWIGVREGPLLQHRLPRFLGNPGGSLWLRRTS